jgi:hypothetical protein
MIRLVLGTLAAAVACFVAISIAGTVFAIPFGVGIALFGVVLVLRTDVRNDPVEWPVTATPPNHERLDVSMSFGDDGRIVAYHRKSAQR